MDKILKSNIADIARLVKTQNWDWLDLNSGIERGGKTSFALEKAWEFSKTHGLSFDWSESLSHLYFFEPNLSEKMMDLPNKSVAIIDEGGEMLFSRMAIDRMVIKIVQTLMIYGAKNIVLMINIPNWRWIDIYVRQARARSLFEIKTIPRLVTEDGNEYAERMRGFYDAYSRKQVIDASRSKYDVGDLGHPCFSGRFSNFAAQHPKEWGYYSAKKNAFLESKRAKHEAKRAYQNPAEPRTVTPAADVARYADAIPQSPKKPQIPSKPSIINL
jgi:hypothetical protein